LGCETEPQFSDDRKADWSLPSGLGSATGAVLVSREGK